MASGQNGYGMGELQGISVDSAGKISGSFSNGQVELLGQLLVANFNNPQGLTKSGQNLYEYSLNSGSPRISGADESGAMINSGFLEMSNVDLSKEFTDMIEVQRAFQAAARVITTSDQLLQEVTAMKR
jgi:flagellar hook protein FlgE